MQQNQKSCVIRTHKIYVETP